MTADDMFVRQTLVAGGQGAISVAGDLDALADALDAIDAVVFNRTSSVPVAPFQWQVRCDGVRPDAVELARSVLGDAAEQCAFYALRSRDVHCRAGFDAATRSMVRKVWLHRRRPGITREEYERRYMAHGPLATVHHANALRYRQNLVDHFAGPPELDADGISEHWYLSLDDAVHRHFVHPESSDEITADVATWLDRATTIGGYGHSWRHT